MTLIMTFKEFRATNPRVFAMRVGTATFVYSHDPDLYRLTDYVVSSVSGPCVILLARHNPYVENDHDIRDRQTNRSSS